MLQPRQSLSTSGATATLSLTNVVTSQLSLQTSVAQSSALTSVTGSTSEPVSLTASSATSLSATNSNVPNTMTTSSSPETTSTSHTTHTPTTTPSTSSETPTSSSTSGSSPTTSSAPSPSSSSTITQPPTSSSSQQGTPTTITSAFTTYVNGSPIVTHTTIPSTIPELSSPSSGERTAIIAGSAAGGTALLIFLLSLAFCVRRKQFKRLDFLRAITLKRKQERSRAAFLDGEDLDDIDLGRVPRQYTDYETPWDGTTHPLVGGNGPDVRWPGTETGSVFREDLSPPAVSEGTRLMDPLANRDDLDLSRIVDDVMGPSSSAAHFSDRSVSSMYRGSMVESEGLVHSRTVSDASNMALLDAAGLGAPGTVSTAPVRSSPLAQPGTKPSPGSVEHRP